jgi:hypothetical protein
MVTITVNSFEELMDVVLSEFFPEEDEELNEIIEQDIRDSILGG